MLFGSNFSEYFSTFLFFHNFVKTKMTIFMKRAFTMLSVLLSFLATAQTENFPGTYYYNSPTEDLVLKMNENQTFDLVFLSGRYELGKDGTISFILNDSPAFVVRENEKGNNNTLKINLKSNFPNTEVKFFYVGYEDENKQVRYENLYNKISSGEEVEEASAEQGQGTIYSLGTFEIPKTQNLYLVNALSMLYFDKPKSSVVIENFTIKDDVSSVDVLITMSSVYRSVSKLSGKYNPQEQSLRIGNFYDEKSVQFEKKKKYDNEKNIKRNSVEEVKNWRHLIDFQDNYSELDSVYSSMQTRVKLDVKDNLTDALKSAKKQGKLLLVFYQPEDTESNREAFKELIKQYESDLGYYSEYEFSRYDIADLYFASAKDEKWFRKKNIKKQNQFICINGEGEILYHEPNTVSGVGGHIFTGSSFLSALEGASLAKKIDNVFNNKRATISEIEEVFLKILTSNAIPAYLYKKESKDKDEITYQDWKYYFENLKNPENLYQFKSTIDQVNAQWKKMIEAHKKDTRLNVPFAVVVGKNYESYDPYSNGRYSQKLFGTEKKADEADLMAVRYLIKFNDEIEKHNQNLSETETDYLSQKMISVYAYDLVSVLDKIAEDSPQLTDKVKQVYTEGKQNGVITYENFKTFLERAYPEEYIGFFEEYYQMMTSADTSNIILSLDKVYSQSKREYYDWILYKNSFATDCNNAAWKIVENHKTDKKLLEKALKWSKTSLELESDNPYFLDTYAHLLYFTGDKAKAVEVQQKAVQMLNSVKEEYEQDTENQMKEALKKMESGSL